MQIIWGDANNPDLNRALATWCAQEIGLPRTFEPEYVTMGVLREGILAACILYNNWQPEAGVIEMHGAALTPRWLTRPVLSSMFGYPFDGLKCQMVVMRVAERNKRLRRILTAYNFKSYPIPRLRGREEGEVIYTLTDDDWRSNGFNKG